MKKLLLVSLVFTVSSMFNNTANAQSSKVVEPEFVGAGIILHKDSTTEDLERSTLKKNITLELEKTNLDQTCVMDKSFKEPVGDKANQSFLKHVNATVTDMKKHVSVDLGVSDQDIILLELSEQKGNAIYILCVNGSKIKYRRTGSVFFKDGSEPYKLNN